MADTLYDLQKDGLTDAQLANQLKKDENLRTRYLVLYDTVNVLVNLTQAKFAVLATTTRKTALFPNELMKLIPLSSSLLQILQDCRV